MNRTTHPRTRLLVGPLLLALLVGLLLGAGPARADATPSSDVPSTGVARTSQVPLFAFYYVWFDAASWDRAKTDTPELGRYTSDDEAVMRQHIQWAKSAGIEGFIVSWKRHDGLTTAGCGC